MRTRAYPHLETVFDTDVLREEIEAWRDVLEGPVQVGWAPGFPQRSTRPRS
ncbi:hypothetical protein ABZ540_35135 [Nocardia xishanensis]|uniref:hypothetical protein n=1 Tax=Nocardia xishanensis TaxID=238964 RepID=UPI0033F224D4